jgi:hypothetical protein
MLKKVTYIMAAVMVLLLALNSTVLAQATITLDGDMSDWTEGMRLDVAPNFEIVTWHDGEIGVNLLRDNSPANPDDPDYMVDVNVAGLFVTDDEQFLYVRVNMNERADVRRVFPGTEVYDADMYPSNGHLELHLSVDPDLLADFTDTTGMTWGWYANGVDFIVPLFPNDPEYFDTTGYHKPITEHLQSGNGWDFGIYQRRPDLGVKLAWNEEWNQVELAIPKSILLQPVYLPDYENDGHGTFVTMYIAAGAFNTFAENEWWSQRVSNDPGGPVPGYVYTYEADWDGDDPETGVSIDPETEIPAGFALLGNYPNPFNPTTNIRFTMQTASQVTIDVYDMLGRYIGTAVDGMFSAGAHSVSFNAEGLTSGIYLYTVKADNHRATGKMTLLK